LLGLKWKREVEVSGRYVDFLVDDIIIECDGDYHFDLHKMDYNESTQFRNLHLLLSGYKLLIFNIF
jgi:very-short-patch-repair endonuclease